MATLTHGTALTGVIDDITSITINDGQELVDVTSMTQAAGDPKQYMLGLLDGGATITAFGTPPATGAEVTIAAGGVTVDGIVETRTVNGQVGDAFEYSITVTRGVLASTGAGV